MNPAVSRPRKEGKRKPNQKKWKEGRIINEQKRRRRCMNNVLFRWFTVLLCLCFSYDDEDKIVFSLTWRRRVGTYFVFGFLLWYGADAWKNMFVFECVLWLSLPVLYFTWEAIFERLIATYTTLTTSLILHWLTFTLFYVHWMDLERQTKWGLTCFLHFCWLC